MQTRVAEDGVREVPLLFEHCEVDDLVVLIGALRLACSVAS